MDRTRIEQDIAGTFGFVPTIFSTVPDALLEAEWALFKSVQVEEHAIPNKYKELIGLGIAAAGKCRYCLFYHTEMARLHGATNAEIEEALHFAKSSVGWSAYISGFQTDFEQFKDEIRRVCEHVRAHRKPQPVGAR